MRGNKKAFRGKRMGCAWWIDGLRIVFQKKKIDDSKMIALSGQAPVLRRLVDCWLREVINWVENRLFLFL